MKTPYNYRCYFEQRCSDSFTHPEARKLGLLGVAKSAVAGILLLVPLMYIYGTAMLSTVLFASESSISFPSHIAVSALLGLIMGIGYYYKIRKPKLKAGTGAMVPTTKVPRLAIVGKALFRGGLVLLGTAGLFLVTLFVYLFLAVHDPSDFEWSALAFAGFGCFISACVWLVLRSESRLLKH